MQNGIKPLANENQPLLTGSLICPGCGKLISAYLEECSFCGLKEPARKKQIAKLLTLGQGSFVKPIIGLCILLFGLGYLLPLLIPGLPGARPGGGLLGFLPAPSSAALALLGWADPRLILAGHYHLLITAIFLHAGFLHIIFNLLWVRDLGAQAELVLGHKAMFLVFVVAGVLGNALAVFGPMVLLSLGIETQLAPIVGASGAVFGLMGAMMAFAKRLPGGIGLDLARQMGKWALVLILLGFVFPGISNAAHIGGFVGGVGVGRLLPLKKGLKAQAGLDLFTLATMGLVAFAFLYQTYLVLLVLS